MPASPLVLFLDTFAGLGVTVGDAAGVVATGVGAPPPTGAGFGFAWTFNCCLAFFSFALAIFCLRSDYISLMKNSFSRVLLIGVLASRV